MIVTKENQRLYCRTWQYNAARIISKLAEIVENNNGRVKYGHAAIISNYSADDARRDYSDKIARLESLEKAESKPVRAEALAEYRRKLDAIGRRISQNLKNERKSFSFPFGHGGRHDPGTKRACYNGKLDVKSNQDKITGG